jgi:hypothetical protein
LEEEDEEDYESEEDTPVIDQDFMNDGSKRDYYANIATN